MTMLKDPTNPVGVGPSEGKPITWESTGRAEVPREQVISRVENVKKMLSEYLDMINKEVHVAEHSVEEKLSKLEIAAKSLATEIYDEAGSLKTQMQETMDSTSKGLQETMDNTSKGLKDSTNSFKQEVTELGGKLKKDISEAVGKLEKDVSERFWPKDATDERVKQEEENIEKQV